MSARPSVWERLAAWWARRRERFSSGLFLGCAGVAATVLALVLAFWAPSPAAQSLALPLLLSGLALLVLANLGVLARYVSEVRFDKATIVVAKAYVEAGAPEKAADYIDEQLRRAQASPLGRIPHHRAARAFLARTVREMNGAPSDPGWEIEADGDLDDGGRFDYRVTISPPALIADTAAPPGPSSLIGVEVRSGARFDPSRVAVSIARTYWTAGGEYDAILALVPGIRAEHAREIEQAVHHACSTPARSGTPAKDMQCRVVAWDRSTDDPDAHALRRALRELASTRTA